MNEIKINPLLDAMSEIEDSNIISTKSTARKGKKRAIIIAAAAAAMLGVAIPVTSAALTRASGMVNGELTEIGYDVYTDEYGNRIETYTYAVPKHVVEEGREEDNAVGKLRAVYDPELVRYPGADPGDYKLVDEEGNEFYGLINDKYVVIYNKEKEETYIMDCGNVKKGYAAYTVLHKHMHGDIEVDHCVYYTPKDEWYDLDALHGLDADWEKAERERTQAEIEEKMGISFDELYAEWYSQE